MHFIPERFIRLPLKFFRATVRYRNHQRYYDTLSTRFSFTIYSFTSFHTTQIAFIFESLEFRIADESTFLGDKKKDDETRDPNKLDVRICITELRPDRRLLKFMTIDIGVTLASFSREILNLRRGFIEFTNPTIVRTCASKIFLPTCVRHTIKCSLAQKLRGFRGVEQNGISPTPGFPPFFNMREFPAI